MGGPEALSIKKLYIYIYIYYIIYVYSTYDVCHVHIYMRFMNNPDTKNTLDVPDVVCSDCLLRKSGDFDLSRNTAVPEGSWKERYGFRAIQVS